jgi:pSer/pThr/pTyr-binding forkhead associated (FHA) protein
MFTLTIEDANGQIADQFTFDHGAYVVGRQDGCDIVLPSNSVSRQHARIFVDGGRCFIEDLGSANGIIVDGQRVIKQRDLGTASQIRIGDYYLYLEFKRRQAAEQNVLSTLFIAEDSDHYKLVRINDSFAGEEFILSETENTIGRTDDNFILLSDPSISRMHARIVRDGNIYTLLDLGSSNGTRLNGKPVAMPMTLKSGDRVQFGNIEFVFADGHAVINPAEYASSNSGFALMAGVVMLVLLGLAAGGLIVFGIFSFRESQQAKAAPPVVETVEDRADALFKEAAGHIERKEWERAVDKYDQLLAHSPDYPDARDKKDEAQKEADAKEMLERAERLVEDGRHEDARDVLQKLPDGTDAYDRGRETLVHVRKSIAHKYRNEAVRLSKSRKKRDWKEAHTAALKALDADPDDSVSLDLVQQLEKKMTKKRMKFEPYQPPR